MDSEPAAWLYRAEQPADPLDVFDDLDVEMLKFAVGELEGVGWWRSIKTGEFRSWKELSDRIKHL